jgi:hypothetical protein
MTAFDCYLPALAGQLGFELPMTEAKRLNFWTTLSQQLIYGREPDGWAPFRIEKWKQVRLKTTNEEPEQAAKDSKAGAEREAKNQNSAEQENDEEDDLENPSSERKGR